MSAKGRLRQLMINKAKQEEEEQRWQQSQEDEKLIRHAQVELDRKERLAQQHREEEAERQRQLHGAREEEEAKQREREELAKQREREEEVMREQQRREEEWRQQQQREEEVRRRKVEEELEVEKERLREEMTRQLQVEREQLERAAEQLRREQEEQREKESRAQEERQRQLLRDQEEEQRERQARIEEEEWNRQREEAAQQETRRSVVDAERAHTVEAVASHAPTVADAPPLLEDAVVPGPAAASRPSTVDAASRRSSVASQASQSVPRTSILLGSKSPLIRSRGSIISRNLNAQPLAADAPFALDSSNLPALPTPPSPPSLTPAPQPNPTSASPRLSPPSWITASDRDGLFDYLADEADLFVHDVALNDSALNALLTAGGSMANTIALCRLIDSKAKQVDSVAALRAEIEAEARQQLAPLHTAAATARAKGAEWMTNAHRDGLFDHLASDGCALFVADVKLNNRALNAMLQQGGSLEATLQVLRTLQERHRAFATVDDLVLGMIEALPPPFSPSPTLCPPQSPEPVPPLPPADTAPPPPTAAPLEQARVEHPAVVAIKAGARQPSSFSFQGSGPPPSAGAQPVVSSQWVTDRDRDALYAFFNAPSTHLFLQPTPLPLPLLTAMLSATGSVYTCIEALSSLQKKGLVFPHPTALLTALQAETALLYPTPTDTSDTAPSPHSSNKAARDALFAYLSSPYCHLFSSSVKLNNLTLDHLLFQGRGLATTLAAAHHLDESGQQFTSAQGLTIAVAAAVGKRGAEEKELRGVLVHPQHQKALFNRPVRVDEADVGRMWVGVQAGEETLAYVLLVEEDILLRGREKLASLDELRHEVQRRHAAMRVERRKEMERLYEWLHMPMRRVMKRGTVVSMEECGRLVMAGREDLRAERPCQSIRIIGDMEAQHEECGGVDDLIRRVAERRKGMNVPLGEKPLLPSAPSLPPKTPSKIAAAVPPVAEVVVSAEDRDALFEWLAGDECAVFSSNVKLNNRALDGLVEAGGGLEGALDAAKAFHADGQQFPTVDALKLAVADWVKARRAASSNAAVDGPEPLSAVAPASPPPAIPPLPSVEPSMEQPSDAESAAVEAAPAPPPPVATLPAPALAAEADAAPLQAPTIAPVSAAAPDARVAASALLADPPAAAAAAAVHPRLQNAAGLSSLPPVIESPPAQPPSSSPPPAFDASGPPPRPVKASSADRDAVFNVLAEETSLFTQDVKLTNKALDSIVAAGRGRASTIDYLKAMHTQHQTFTTIPALLTALRERTGDDADNPQQEVRSALFAWMTGAECQLFDASVRLSDAELDALLKQGKGLTSTLALLRRVQAHPRQFSSVTPLLQCLTHLAALPSLPAAPAPPMPASERDALFDYLASDSCNVFTTNVKLSNKTLDRLLAAGHGLQPTLTILRLLNLRAEQVATVPQLVASISAEYAAAYDALTDLTIFFNSPLSPLPLPAPPHASLLQFYWDAETGHELLYHLRSIPASPPVPDLESLLPLVSASRVTELMEMNGQVAALHGELGVAVGGGKKVGGKGGLRGVLKGGEVEGLTVGECWQLAKAGKVGLQPGKAAVYVQELLVKKRTFSSVQALIDAVRQRSQEEQGVVAKTVVKPHT